MIKKLFILACALAVIGAATGGALYYAYPVQVGALTRNYLITWFAPPGTTTTELNSAYTSALAVVATAGGVVFFGDVGGNFYVLDAASGEKLWGQQLGGAIGGGVITYTAGGAQKVAVAAGFTHPVWPTKIVTAKVVVLGLDSAAASR